jgi:hypothetical protein
MAKTVKSSLYEDLKRRILTMELDPDDGSRRGLPERALRPVSHAGAGHLSPARG